MLLTLFLKWRPRGSENVKDMLQIIELPSTRCGFHSGLLDLRALTLSHWTMLPLLDPQWPRPTLQWTHSLEAAHTWMMTGTAPSRFVQPGSKAHTRGDMAIWHQAISSILGRSTILTSPRKLWKKSSCHCLITPLQWLVSMTITVTLRPMVQFCFFVQITLAQKPGPRPIALPINTHLQ